MNAETKETAAGFPLDWDTTEVKLGKGRFTHTLRRPTPEQLIARDQELQTEIPIGKDGGYSLPDPTASEDVDAKLYDQIVVSADGYDGDVPARHKAAAIEALYRREVEIDEDCNVFADVIPVREEFGSGDEPDFVITHVMRQPTEGELRKFRGRSNAGEIKPGKRGRQKFVTASNLKMMIQHYDMWVHGIEGVRTNGVLNSQQEVFALVDPLIKRRVVQTLVEAVSNELLD